MRKAFTVSERVAIGAAMEAELQGRVGNPQLKAANVENFPPLQPEGKTRDLVAKATVSATARPMSRPNRLNQNHCYKNHSAVSIAKTIGHVYCGLHNSCHAVLIVSINHTATPAAASPHGRPRAPRRGAFALSGAANARTLTPAEGGLKPPRVRNGDDNNAVQVGYVG